MTLRVYAKQWFAQLNVKNVKYEAVTDNPTFHPGRCAKISAGNKVIGIIGEIHPAVSRKYGIETPVYIAELVLRMYSLILRLILSLRNFLSILP